VTFHGRIYGELDDALNWSCGYSDTPTSPPCMDPAVWHGIILSEPIQVMSSCDEHRPIMDLSADYVHEMGSACGLPGSYFIWPDNECILPDDGTELLAHHAEACRA